MVSCPLKKEALSVLGNIEKIKLQTCLRSKNRALFVLICPSLALVNILNATTVDELNFVVSPLQLILLENKQQGNPNRKLNKFCRLTRILSKLFLRCNLSINDHI